jgi:hypothetical protein
MSIFVKKLLIYIPAYSDYKSAAEQARLIRREKAQVDIQIHVVISVNAITLDSSTEQNLRDSCDEFIYYSENLGGDTNINLGYLKALSTHSNYLWILSANDLLNIGAIQKIVDAICGMPNDFLVIHQSGVAKTGKIDNAFIGEASILPIGLISAVIFKVDSFTESFASALKFSWTGWGQLSVIQNSLFELGTLSYKVLSQDEIYDRSQNIPADQQRLRNQSHYRHSFFGYPLVISLLFDNNKKVMNQIIRGWLYNNWYKIGFFKRGYSPYLVSGSTAKDVFWTERLSRQFILRSGPLSPILYFLGNSGLIFRLQNSTLSKRLRNIMKAKQSLGS